MTEFNYSNTYATTLIRRKAAQRKLGNYMEAVDKRRTITRAREFELIKDLNICPTQIVNKMNGNMPTFNMKKLRTLSRNNFYDPSVMKSISCIMNTIMHVGEHGVSMEQKLHTYLNNLKHVGGKSTEGYAITANMNRIKDMFIVKTPKEDVDDDLLHELFIGFIINKLRELIPNFMYVYAGFRCSAPIINDKTKIVESWCRGGDENKVSYVLYENISNSVSMSEYITTCTTTEFTSIYLQIIFSLMMALEYCNYTHYDLHTTNVLVRNVDLPSFQIHYIVKDVANEIKNIYLKSNKVATIIDYGFSHVTYGNEEFGNESPINNTSGIYSNIFFDLYKCLMFSGLITSTRNPELYSMIEDIYKYFNREEPLIVMINTNNIHFKVKFPFIQSDETKANFTIYKYIDHIIKVSQKHGVDIDNVISFDKYDKVKLLKCESMCDDIISKANEIVDTITPTTVIQLYNIRDSINKDIIEEFKSEYFNITNNVVSKHINDYSRIVDKAIDTILNMPKVSGIFTVPKAVDLNTTTTTEDESNTIVIDEDAMDEEKITKINPLSDITIVKELYYDCLRFVELFDRSTFYFDSGVYVSKILDSPGNVKRSLNIKHKLYENINTIHNQLYHFIDIDNSLNAFMREHGDKVKEHNKDDFSWYNNTSLRIRSIVDNWLKSR